LQELLPRGTEITVVTDRVEVDGLGRVSGYVYKGTLDVNRELLRKGHAVTHVIWPNTYGRFNEFRNALLEATSAGRGMWNPANPIQGAPVRVPAAGVRAQPSEARRRFLRQDLCRHGRIQARAGGKPDPVLDPTGRHRCGVPPCSVNRLLQADRDGRVQFIIETRLDGKTLRSPDHPSLQLDPAQATTGE
jgi:hypothetical protein